MQRITSAIIIMSVVHPVSLLSGSSPGDGGDNGF